MLSCLNILWQGHIYLLVKWLTYHRQISFSICHRSHISLPYVFTNLKVKTFVSNQAIKVFIRNRAFILAVKETVYRDKITDNIRTIYCVVWHPLVANRTHYKSGSHHTEPYWAVHQTEPSRHVIQPQNLKLISLQTTPQSYLKQALLYKCQAHNFLDMFLLSFGTCQLSRISNSHCAMVNDLSFCTAAVKKEEFT